MVLETIRGEVGTLEPPCRSTRCRVDYRESRSLQAPETLSEMDYHTGFLGTARRGVWSHGLWLAHLIESPVRKDRFEFDILLAGPVVRLAKFFRLNEYPLIKMGSWYIQNYDESKLRAFCANPKISELIESFSFGMTDAFRPRGRPDLSEGVAEIYFERAAAADGSLKTLIELFEEILIQLVAIGSASEEAPNIEL